MLNRLILFVLFFAAIGYADTRQSYETADISLIPAIQQEIVGILSRYFNKSTQIESISRLSEEERRNLLVRLIIRSPLDAAFSKSVIFKQSLSGKIANESEEDVIGRFASDWAGLDFLSQIKTETLPVPKFYGGSIQHRFILIEDLGKKHISLLDFLNGNHRNSATIALEQFMLALGQLHSNSYGKTDNFLQILKKIDPGVESWQAQLKTTLDKNVPALKLWLEKINSGLSPDRLAEVRQIYEYNFSPGPFTTFIHGDVGPENSFVIPNENKLYLIDFEWCSIKNALLDGTCLRMSFPTAGGDKAVPKNIIDIVENAYRMQLKKNIPAARSDDEYATAYVNAAAFWMLRSILLLEYVLEYQEVWALGPTPYAHSDWQDEANRIRPLILSQLVSFIEVSKKNKKRPHLSLLAEEVLHELKTRWPDLKLLDVYPAFEGLSSRDKLSPH